MLDNKEKILEQVEVLAKNNLNFPTVVKAILYVKLDKKSQDKLLENDEKIIEAITFLLCDTYKKLKETDDELDLTKKSSYMHFIVTFLDGLINHKQTVQYLKNIIHDKY